MLIVVGLVVVLVQGVANGDNSSSYSNASGSANVVTGGLTAVGNGIGAASQSMGQSLSNGSRVLATDTSKGTRMVVSGVSSGAQSAASIVGGSTLFAAETSLRTIGFAASAAVRTADFASAVTTESMHGIVAADSQAVRVIGRTAWSGEYFMGHSVVTSLDYTARGTGHIGRMVSNTAVMSSVFRPTDNGKVPVIHALAYEPISLAKPVTKPAPEPAPAPAPPAPAAPQLPVQAATVVTDRSLSAAKANDLYAWGNCTWWVFIKRFEVGDPIPNTWGNATNWAYAAQLDGYTVDHHPTPGSIMQISGVDYGLGHVAFVESVDSDGTWHISEMNVLGLDVVDNKAEPASAAANYRFIHDAN